MSTGRPVLVVQLPERMHSAQAQAFFLENTPLLKTDRPQVVFDFSDVRQIDSMGVDMLLNCLETIMKRDGDLKLAAVPPQAAVILQMTRIDRLFEIYENASVAVESFHSFPVPGMAQAPAAWMSQPVHRDSDSGDDARVAG